MSTASKGSAKGREASKIMSTGSRASASKGRNGSKKRSMRMSSKRHSRGADLLEGAMVYGEVDLDGKPSLPDAAKSGGLLIVAIVGIAIEFPLLIPIGLLGTVYIGRKAYTETQLKMQIAEDEVRVVTRGRGQVIKWTDIIEVRPITVKGRGPAVQIECHKAD